MPWVPIVDPSRGMSRTIPPAELPDGAWWMLCNIDLYPGKFRRRKGTTQVHSVIGPAGTTIMDLIEFNDPLNDDQDVMLALCKKSDDSLAIYRKVRAAGGSYGAFSQVTFTGVLETLGDTDLLASEPYGTLVRTPTGARVIPGKADADAKRLYFREFPDGYQIYAKTGSPLTVPNGQVLFTDARLFEPVDVHDSEFSFVNAAWSGSENGDLGPFKRYVYAYTLVYDDGQESLPWIEASKSRIPDDLIIGGKFGGITVASPEDETITIKAQVDAMALSTPTGLPLRLIGINVWRAAFTGANTLEGEEGVLGDFHLLGFMSMNPTGLEGDYYDTGLSFSAVQPSNPSGSLKRFDTGIDLQTGTSSPWNNVTTAASPWPPTGAAIVITAVDGDTTDALVGSVFGIEDWGTPDQQNIDVNDPGADLDTATNYSAKIVEGIFAPHSDGDYYALLTDSQDDISANPELWSALGVAEGETDLEIVGAVGGFHGNRLWQFDLRYDGERHAAEGVPSKPGKYDSFSTLDTIEFTWDGGEPIVGFAFVGNTLLVFKRRSVGQFRVGEDAAGVVLADGEPLMDDGLASRHSIVVERGTAFWAGYRGMWMYSEAGGFQRISENAVEELWAKIDDDDKELTGGGWDPETRKYVAAVPIVNGSTTWDDMFDPVSAPGGLTASRIAFEFDTRTGGWGLSDRSFRFSRRGVQGEWYTSDFSELRQQLAAYGDESETYVRWAAITPWLAGLGPAGLTSMKFIYKDGPVYVKGYRNEGEDVTYSQFPDSNEARRLVEARVGMTGAAVYAMLTGLEPMEAWNLFMKARSFPGVTPES